MELQHEHGVSWGLHEGVARIVLDRPERNNAVGEACVAPLVQAIDSLLAAQPRVLLLSARGRIFCAGGDIDEFIAAGEHFDALVDRILEPLHPALQRLAEAPLPVVTAVNGPIGGAGVGLALCGDFVIAAQSMKLRTGYAAIGLSPDAGASYHLARRVGPLRAQQWFMLSDVVDAQQCLQAGAVDQVVPDDQLQATAEALVARLARSAPGSMAAIKQLCRGQPGRNLHDHLALEHRLLHERTRSADAKEGIAAFVGKRVAQFKGD